MAQLTNNLRNNMPGRPFIPRRKPDPNDPNEAQNGMARAAMFGSPEEKEQVQAKVKKKYPGQKPFGGNNG